MPNSPAEQYSSPRAYPRLPLATPVEIHYGDTKILGRTENISLGGLLAQCKKIPPRSAELTVLFNLPNGTTIVSPGIVRHVHGRKIGVQFSSLPPTGRQALEGFTRTMESYTRRGERKPRRLHVTLRPTMHGSEKKEEMAETVLLSRNGGLVICRAHFEVGARLQLYWPDKKRTAEIVIVFRRPCGTENLAELGFEFLDVDDFWGIGSETH